MKIGRDTFIYLEPSQSARKDYAQCATCALYLSKDHRCLIHGPRLDISPDASCCFYVHGSKPIGTVPQELVSPSESGLVHRQVRCENCAFFKADSYKCLLFAALDRDRPDWFDLGTRVDPKACCNANTPKGSGDSIEKSVRRAFDAIKARD